MEEGRVLRVLKSEVARDIPMVMHLREVKAKLLRIKVTMGKVTMPGVVDMGSTISLISTDLWEKLGLLSMPLDGMSFPVIGVSGKWMWCQSWVPGVCPDLLRQEMQTRGHRRDINPSEIHTKIVSSKDETIAGCILAQSRILYPPTWEGG